MRSLGSRKRVKARLLTLFALVFCIGCGRGDRVPISGTVTFNGVPVQKGVISFEPFDRQGPTTGGKIANGKYELVGDAAPLPGKKTVRISGGRKTGRKLRRKLPPPNPPTIDEIERIPDTYNTRTILTREVSHDGPREIDFTLKSR